MVPSSRGTRCPSNAENSTSPIMHGARHYQTFPGSNYPLPADEAERQSLTHSYVRLLLQHGSLKKLFGEKLLFAPVRLNPGGKILDIGTGLGVWLLDLAQSLGPSVSLIGVDIEPRLFPTSPPTNCEFSTASVTDLPEHWSSAFSLVHQRLFIVALQVSEWPVAIQEMHRVLSPGGWIQIDETAPWYEGEYPEQPCMRKLVAMFRCLARARNLYADCIDDIPVMLARAGFVDIRSEVRVKKLGKWAGDVGVANRINHLGAMRGLKTPILEAGGFGYVRSDAEYEALLAGVEKEWEEVPGTELKMIIFWAHKPIK
ncbi:S-adenosyl-L-methionine-dependent methyltransferase [Mycena filopes]|nr:S-adenosyl-L-methionine-dependent methyltransferase [Mycena filopes]